MRRFWLAWPGLLLSVTWMLAQQLPPQPQPQDPNSGRLDEILGNWEKVMTGVQSMAAYCNRTTLDKTFQTTEVFEGTAKFLKSNLPNQTSRASLEMFKKGRPEVFEKYICSGNFLYEFVPSAKVIRVHELPPPKQGQISDDNFLSFLFGMKAVEAKARYNIVHVPSPATDKWYYYLRIHPKAAADKADFTEARLVLTANNFLPRQLWFQQPNGSEVTWDFPKVVNNAELHATDFGQPNLPAGWQFLKVPREPQPRVMRQNQ
jgi:TIGR03009 family protein